MLRRFPAFSQHMLALIICVLLIVSVGLLGSGQPTQAASSFVTHDGSHFVLDGKPFYFAGSNNYYPIYVSDKMVDDFLHLAQQQGLKVVRIWAMLDIGSVDGSVPNIDGDGPKDGVYFQYWDKAAGKPAYNDGKNGLEKLDYAIKRAADFDLKVVPVLINNWQPFGGMDQYVQWYGLKYHDDFYSDAKAQQAYKGWVNHVITRKNSLTETTYSDDPTIFAWELANEPRCKGTGGVPTSPNCTTTTITNWVNMMSAYIKSLDSNHMIAVGDEGLFNRPGNPSWPYAGKEGVDNEAFLKISTIDYGTYHLYPQDWGVNPDAWAVQWITDHIAAGKAAQKPVVLEEFGSKPSADRDPYYQRWTYAVCANGGAGWMYWLLSGHRDDGSYYPDYDGYNVNDTQTTYNLLKIAGARISAQSCGAPPPTATLTPTALYTSTPTPTVAPGTTIVDDSVTGTGQNQFNYSGGGWTHCTACNEPSPAVFYNASQSWDSTTDDAAIVAFTGTQVVYYAVVGPTHGMAAVSIDGGSETIVDLYGKIKTGDVAVWTSPVIPSGSHTLKIRVAGNKNAASTSNVITLDHVNVITTP